MNSCFDTLRILGRERMFPVVGFCQLDNIFFMFLCLSWNNWLIVAEVLEVGLETLGRERMFSAQAGRSFVACFL